MSIESAGVYSPKLGQYRSPHSKLNVLLVALGVFLVAVVVSVVSTLMEQSVLERALNNEAVTMDEALSNDQRQMIVSTLYMLCYWATGVFFLSWIHRASSNIHAMRCYQEPVPCFSIGWSIGWWFVPFANLFVPHQVMRELSRFSSPGVAGLRPLLLLMWVWWLLFVANGILSTAVAFSVPWNREDVEVLMWVNNLELLCSTFDVFTALMLGFIVLQISKRQVRRFLQLTNLQPLRMHGE